MLYPSGRTSCSDIRRKHRYRQGGRVLIENGPCPQQRSSEIDRIYGVDHNSACPQSPVRWSSKPYRWKLSQFPHVAVAVLALALGSGGPLGVLAQSTEDDADGDAESSDTPVWQSIGSYVVIVVLVAASGLFSGLTLGLLGLDKIGLEIISNGDEPRVAAFAKVGRRRTRSLLVTHTYERQTISHRSSCTIIPVILSYCSCCKYIGCNRIGSGTAASIIMMAVEVKTLHTWQDPQLFCELRRQR